MVWTHTRYQRARVQDGKLINVVSKGSYTETLVKHGYVVGAVDVRGGGASFGVRHGAFNRAETYDAYDITEWFAEQPWCDGRIGMFGRSYLGITQYLAATTCPPHLVAIFPEMALMDIYDFCYAGGVYKYEFMKQWGGGTKKLDTLPGVAPVDKDTDGSLLAKALAEHQGNSWIHEMMPSLPYRDSWHAPSNGSYWFIPSPISYWKYIQDSKVAIYHWAGWFDSFPRDQIVLYKNLKNPQKIALGNWSHSSRGKGKLMEIEHLRWYDYWLKGIDNGIMKEPSTA